MPSIPSNETARGLLTSWLLVGLPATSGFLVFFIGGRPPHKTIENAIAVGLFWALVTTLVVGTALFGIVRAGQLLGMQEVTWADRFLLGRDRRESGRWLLGVGVLSALLFLALAVQSPERIAVYEHSVAHNGGIGAGTLVTLTGAFSLLAVVHGYRNDGLLVGWVLVGLPMLSHSCCSGWHSLSTLDRAFSSPSSLSSRRSRSERAQSAGRLARSSAVASNGW